MVASSQRIRTISTLRRTTIPRDLIPSSTKRRSIANFIPRTPQQAKANGAEDSIPISSKLTATRATAWNSRTEQGRDSLGQMWSQWITAEQTGEGTADDWNV